METGTRKYQDIEKVVKLGLLEFELQRNVQRVIKWYRIVSLDTYLAIGSESSNSSSQHGRAAIPESALDPWLITRTVPVLWMDSIVTSRATPEASRTKLVQIGQTGSERRSTCEWKYVKYVHMVKVLRYASQSTTVRQLYENWYYSYLQSCMRSGRSVI